MTTVLPCAVVMKFGKLNFPEPSGPLQACNGTAVLLLKSRAQYDVTVFQAAEDFPL